MLTKTSALSIILSVSVAAVAGCQSVPSADVAAAAHAGERHVVPSLVTVRDDQAIAGTMHGWEAFRHDEPVSPRVTPDRGGTVFVEVWHREHLRTTSGRPREHTITRSRSIHRFGRRR